MIPSNEEIDNWTHFLHARWQRYAREQKLSEKAQRKQLPAFMAGGNAILAALLKWQNGETYSIVEWADKIGISSKTLRSRVKKLDWSVVDALTLPPNGKRG